MTDFREYSELYHHGIKGMKWGVRKYQNYDGTLTERGRKRYQRDLNKLDAKASQHAADSDMFANKSSYYKDRASEAKTDKKKEKFLKKSDKFKAKSESEKAKMKEYESEQYKGIGDALERGFNVNRFDKYRVNKRAYDSYGKRFARSMIMGGIPNLAYSIIKSANFDKKYSKYYSRQNTKNDGLMVKGNVFTLDYNNGDKGSFNTVVDLSKYFPGTTIRKPSK